MKSRSARRPTTSVTGSEACLSIYSAHGHVPALLKAHQLKKSFRRIRYSLAFSQAAHSELLCRIFDALAASLTP